MKRRKQGAHLDSLAVKFEIRRVVSFVSVGDQKAICAGRTMFCMSIQLLNPTLGFFYLSNRLLV